MTDLERFESLTGYPCNLDDPQTHSEWVMWYKRNCRDPLLTTTADKIAVRDYVRSLGYGWLLNEAKAYYSTEYATLEPPCVVKMNNASGRNWFVRNESHIDTAMKSVDAWLQEPYGDDKEEWAYKNIRPGFLVEKMLWKEGERHMLYRFLCWRGEVKLIEADEYEVVNGEIAHVTHTMYSPDWKRQRVTIDGRKVRYSRPPANLELMKEIARVMAEPFRFVRIDLYEYGGGVGFSEFTHYPRSGKYRYEPRSFDEMMGRLW